MADVEMRQQKAAGSSEVLLEVKNLKKYFQVGKNATLKAVDDVSFEIYKGETLGMVGESGCGKTTTLRMIAGFESPDEGEIYLGNEAINELTPNKRDTAMVFPV